MRKTSLTLTLSAFAGLCAAQSSVTVYGVIDESISRLNGGTSVINGGPAGTIGIRSGWAMKPSTTSRLGFRGTEDLGGGLRANFVVEHRFRPDDGTLENPAAFWQGMSYVGLSGGFGEVRLGRQFTPTFLVSAGMDPWGLDYNVAGAGAFVRGATGLTENPRSSNAVVYASPTVSGFSGMAFVGLGEGSAASNPDTQGFRQMGGSVTFTGGPLAAAIGYNTSDVPTGKRNLVNGYVAYDLGVVRPIVSYSQSKDSFGTPATPQTKAYLVGATAPLGQGRLKFVVARKDPSGSNNETTKVGLGYEYFLSKRTSVHADIGTASTKGLTRTNGYEAGLKHSF